MKKKLRQAFSLETRTFLNRLRTEIIEAEAPREVLAQALRLEQPDQRNDLLLNRDFVSDIFKRLSLVVVNTAKPLPTRESALEAMAQIYEISHKEHKRTRGNDRHDKLNQLRSLTADAADALLFTLQKTLVEDTLETDLAYTIFEKTSRHLGDVTRNNPQATTAAQAAVERLYRKMNNDSKRRVLTEDFYLKPQASKRQLSPARRA